MDNAAPTIAIVDDDEIVRRALGRLLATLSYRPVEFESGEAFVSTLERQRPDCVLLDLHMPGLDGLGVLRRTREASPGVPVIMITAVDQEGVSESCIAAGARDCLLKPLSREALHLAIQSALRA